MGKLSRWLGRKTGTPSARQISLLDLESGDRVVDWWAVFYPRTPHFWFAHLMKQGFRHVELMRPHYYGPLATDVMWLVLRPNFEILENHIEFDPTPPWTKYPGVTIVPVKVLVKSWKVRSWFQIGPPTCVEAVKYALGINSFWMRTPHQLYKFLKSRNGVLGV